MCPETRPAGGGAARGEALSDRHRCGPRRGQEELRGSPRERRPRRDGRYEGPLFARKGGRRGTATAGAPLRTVGGAGPGAGAGPQRFDPRASRSRRPSSAPRRSRRAARFSQHRAEASFFLLPLEVVCRAEAEPRTRHVPGTCRAERRGTDGARRRGETRPEGSERRRAGAAALGSGRDRELRVASPGDGAALSGGAAPRRSGPRWRLWRAAILCAALRRRAEADRAGKPGLPVGPLRRRHSGVGTASPSGFSPSALILSGGVGALYHPARFPCGTVLSVALKHSPCGSSNTAEYVCFGDVYSHK